MSDVEEQLARHLGSWDEHPPSNGLSDAELAQRLGDPPDDDAGDVDDDAAVDGDLPDGNEFDERDLRIEELETERERLTAAEREREDRAEWERAAVQIAGDAVGVPFETIKSAILGAYVSDEHFRDACDHRGDDPLAWQFALENLAGQFPPSDHGMSAAVRLARDVIPSGGGSDHDYGDFSRMDTREFAVKSRQVFDDMREGRLKAEARGGGGFFTTDPRRIK